MIRKPGKLIAAATLAVVALLMSAGVASAHVSASASTTGAGEYSLISFSVPHGCDDKGTTSVEIQMEEDFASVTPYEALGWSVAATKRKPAETIKGAHGDITEVTDVVTYTRTDGPLPDGTGSVLPISVQLPEDAAGKTLFFPTIQICEKGGKTSWINKPEEGEDAHSIDDPAPAVMVTEAGGGHGDEAKGDDHGDEAKGDDHGDEATDDHDADEADDEIDSVRTMAFIALALGALGLILALLGLRGRSKENSKK